MTQWQHLAALINQLNANTDDGIPSGIFLVIGLMIGMFAYVLWDEHKKHKYGKNPAISTALISACFIICGVGAGINGIIKQDRYQKLEPQVIQQLRRVDYHHAYLTQSVGGTRIIVNPQRMTPASAQHALVIRRNMWNGDITTEHVVSTPLANVTVVKATPKRIAYALVERNFQGEKRWPKWMRLICRFVGLC